MLYPYDKIHKNHFNEFAIVIISISLSLSYILLKSYSFLIIVILLPLIFNLKIRHINLIIIIALSTIISEISESLRVMVVLLSFSVLIFSFLKKYGTKTRNYRRTPESFLIYFLLLCLAFFFSTVFSLNVSNSLIEVFRTIIFFLFIYVLYSLIENVTDLIFVIIGLIISTIIISLSIWDSFLFSGYDIYSLIAKTQFRAIGLYSNVNAPGSYLIAIVPFLVASIVYPGLKKLRLPIVTVLVFILFSAMLSVSRSALIGIFTAILVTLYFLNRKVFKYGIVSSIIILFLLIILPEFDDLFSLYLRFDSGLTYRDDLWKIAFNIFKDFPLTGIGPGNYTDVMLKYFPLMLGSWKAEIILLMRDVTPGSNLSHNFYLSMLSDLGILGLISSLYLTIIFSLSSLKLIKVFNPAEHKLDFYLVISAFAGGIGIFVRSIFEGIGIMTYGWIKMDLPFWILVIVIMYYSRNRSQSFNG